MWRYLFLLSFPFLLLLIWTNTGAAFSVVPATLMVSSNKNLALSSQTLLSSSSSSSSSSTAPADPAAATPALGLTNQEQQVYNLFQLLHKSNFPFRMILVGTDMGAILESTHTLGPVFKVNASPKSGKNLLTIAAVDQSFEFHVTLGQVAKMHLVERCSQGGGGSSSSSSSSNSSNTSKNTLRILRFTTSSDESVCTLILADQSAEAIIFFGQLMEKYGATTEF